MNLKQLAELTGHKSISDMSDEELYEHLSLIRKSRATSKLSDAKRTERAPTTKKRKTKVDLAKFSQAELEALIKQLGG